MARQYKPTTIVLNRFKELYLDKYGSPYKVRNPRDNSLIKRFLTDKYPLDKCLQIVEVAVRDYEKLNKNPEYALGVHSFTSVEWLREKIVIQVEQGEKDMSQMEEKAVRNKEQTKKALNKLLEHLEGGN